MVKALRPLKPPPTCRSRRRSTTTGSRRHQHHGGHRTAPTPPRRRATDTTAAGTATTAVHGDTTPLPAPATDSGRPAGQAASARATRSRVHRTAAPRPVAVAGRTHVRGVPAPQRRRQARGPGALDRRLARPRRERRRRAAGGRRRAPRTRCSSSKGTFPVLDAHRALQPATWGYDFTTSTLVPGSADQRAARARLPDAGGDARPRGHLDRGIAAAHAANGHADREGRPVVPFFLWSGCRDLNPGPHRPERCALPGCATPRRVAGYPFAGRLFYHQSAAGSSRDRDPRPRNRRTAGPACGGKRPSRSPRALRRATLRAGSGRPAAYSNTTGSPGLSRNRNSMRTAGAPP